MAFLDNSGDIILDAVLTDLGRTRLAKGDGSFRIAKFALGDDEVDYSLYDHAASGGSAYYDLDILSTPILEAFTDNYSGLKSKLLSIPRNDLLFLPVIKLNNTGQYRPSSIGVHCVASDESTETLFNKGTMAGIFGSANPGLFKASILLQQGLDTQQIPYSNVIDSDLKETQYIVEMDSRLGMLLMEDRNTPASISYIDDDQIASYYLTLSSDKGLVKEIKDRTNAGGPDTAIAISGPRGTELHLNIKANLDLQYSNFLFERLGYVSNLSINSLPATDFHVIDSNIRVTGATTGYRIDVPVRFLKIA